MTAIASMLAGVVGCAVVQSADTTVPYAVYGIAASAAVLLALALITPVHHTEATHTEVRSQA